MKKAIAEHTAISANDILPCGFWNKKPTTCIALPIMAPGHDVPTGILLCGIGQMRLLDESYATFYNLGNFHGCHHKLMNL